MTVDISVLIAIGGILLSAATFFIGRVTAAKTDGIADGEMQANVRHIKDTVDKQDKKLNDIAENYIDLKDEIAKLKERLHVLEDRVKMLHGGE